MSAGLEAFKGVTTFDLGQPEPLPEVYKRHLAGQEVMPKDDLDYINNLFDIYGIGRESLSQRRGDLFEMAGVFRLQLDAIGAQPDRNGLSAAKRIEDLSYLFLHYTPIKKEVTKLHQEKLAAALPGFDHALSTTRVSLYHEHEMLTAAVTGTALSFHPQAVRNRYFDRAERIMQNQLIATVDTLYPEGQEVRQSIDSLGIVIGHSVPENNQIIKSGVQNFAITGIGTFRNFLQTVIEESIEEGEPIQKKLREEFLEKDGVPFTLMRTSLRGAAALGNEAFQSLTSLRQALSDVGKARDRGLCPAGLPGQRPLAYEYAMTIVNHMPAELLAKTA